ncbi:MAG: hypothetical protein LBK59_02865 [Bifidobacteriaceae bacterium]|jgi:hypothetical protein|nr:hypothetical protein [Bifidobacteriaceae bacterium]
MVNKHLVAGIALVSLSLGTAVAVASPMAAADTRGAGVAVTAKAAPSVVTKVIKGTKATGVYMPESHGYHLEMPALKGVSAKVKKAFTKRINALVASELKNYARGALWDYEFQKSYYDYQYQPPGVPADPQKMTEQQYYTYCQTGFKDLKGWFTGAVYQGRYASVVLTFSGINAPCEGLGGMWVEYRTNRSVTIDTQTGKLMDLADFTSNSAGKVNAALKKWYQAERRGDDFCPKGSDAKPPSRSHLEDPWKVCDHAGNVVFPLPKVTKKLSVCDRPGNVMTINFLQQRRCYFDIDTLKTGLVAWQVRNAGLRLTFPGGDAPRYILLPWSQIPRSI